MITENEKLMYLHLTEKVESRLILAETMHQHKGRKLYLCKLVHPSQHPLQVIPICEITSGITIEDVDMTVASIYCFDDTGTTFDAYRPTQQSRHKTVNEVNQAMLEKKGLLVH